MILGKGFLLAHAKAKDGVLTSSAALTLFQHPITMQSGKKIRCIICLAPQNQHDHLDFLALLLQKLNDAAWCKSLFAKNSQKKAGVLHLDECRHKTYNSLTIAVRLLGKLALPYFKYF